MKGLQMAQNKFTFSTLISYACLLTIVLIYSCKKNTVENPIPNVPVNLSINLTMPQYAPLNSIGNSVYLDGGYRGIILYRRSLTEFVSFDRACPYSPTTDGVKLEIDTSGIASYDPHCGSKFSLYDGSILKGPAASPMKPYNTDYDAGNNMVYIYNQ
jgi:nitrite reductase/ring-hydroxylating ferredoxin subunit